MPAMMMAGAGTALSVGGGVAKMFGGQSQAKAAQKAAQMYIDYQERERKKFLDANSPDPRQTHVVLTRQRRVRRGHDAGHEGRRQRGLWTGPRRCLSNLGWLAIGKNSGGGNVYTPGRYDRALRQLGQNLAMNKAKMIRDVNQKNADLAVSNQRFAVSAMPTYSPGLSATPQIGYDAFQGLNATAPVGNYIGDMMQSLGQPAMSAGFDGLVKGPIAERLAQARMQQQQPGPWSWGYNASPIPELLTRTHMERSTERHEQQVQHPQAGSDAELSETFRGWAEAMSATQIRYLLAHGSAGGLGEYARQNSLSVYDSQRMWTLTQI